MTDPTVTVVILAVLWLIVAVPMVLQRRDARAGQRSVARFGAVMRTLGSRRGVRTDATPSPISASRATPST